MNSLRRLLLILCLSAAFTASMFAQAPATVPTAPTANAKPVKVKSLLDLYLEGGSLMHPILLCSIGTIAVCAYCFIQIAGSKIVPKHHVSVLTNHLKVRDAGGAYEYCTQNPCVFTNVISAGLLKVNFERDLANKASMEQSAGEALDQEETRLMLWVNYLNVFATIAPMLGLLGTVTGMIASFDQLAAGRSEPQDLAGGIGEAMITTAGGLFVGIPAMFFYFFYRNKLVAIMADVHKKATFLIDVLSGELKLEEAIEHPPGGEAAAETPAQ